MRKIYLTINTDSADLRYNNAVADVITNPLDAPQIYAGEEVIFCCTFIGEDLQTVSFAETDTFDIGIDQNFDHADDLMAYANTFNQSGDWDEASPAAGKLSFRVSTATTGAVEKLANIASLQVKLEIRQFSAGSSLPSILCQAPAVMHNTVIGSAASAEDAEVFATAAQVSAAQSTADTALANAATAQSTADTALANAAAAQSTADTALANAAAAQSSADTALANAADAQTAANSKLSAPVAAGTAGQVLTLDTDAVTPVWANPAGGSGGLTKWGAWEARLVGTTYTAATDGWLKVFGSATDANPAELYINGVAVWSISITDRIITIDGIGIVPVFAGQTYEANSSCINLQFAPCV